MPLDNNTLIINIIFKHTAQLWVLLWHGATIIIYVNIFMGELEQHVLQNAPGELTPLEWIRFIHDIFAIWPHGTDKLMEFLTYI